VEPWHTEKRLEKYQPNKIIGTMKRFIDIIVAREEGYTHENFMAGALFVAGIVAVCLIAEIINAL
jgi:hypothetical protein